MSDVLTAPTRPLLRYHGGKWRLAPWIISHFPAHRVYVEPYCGAASVLMRKARSYAEVINDLDGEVVNLFKVVRDRGDELVRVLELTPYSRAEYLEAWYPSEDAVEQARRTVMRAYMGFGSAAVTKTRAVNNSARGGLATTGFRQKSNMSGTSPGHDWSHFPDVLRTIIERLQGCVIECRNALEVLVDQDAANSLHYVDPPYVAETRDAGGDYRHEMTDAQHVELAGVLHGLKGMVVLSGYHSALYDGLFADWHRVEKAAHADGARARTEVLWMNFKPEGMLL